MKPLTETVTITREVPTHIADLVNFARVAFTYSLNTKQDYLEDDILIKLARDFWDTQHGEE